MIENTLIFEANRSTNTYLCKGKPARSKKLHYTSTVSLSSLQSLLELAQREYTSSEIDNDAYCVCMHDFSPCTHRNIRPVRTMYEEKMRTQIKIPLKLSQNDNLSTSIVRLLCQQSKSSYNTNATSDRFILHTMQYIMYLQ